MKGRRATTSSELLDDWLHVGDSEIADRVAITTREPHGWAELTYGALDRQSRVVASRLAEAGVQPADRVALFGESGGDWAAAMLGILRRGAIAVTLDVKLTPEELATLCHRSQLAAAIVSPTFAERWVDPVPLIDLAAPGSQIRTDAEVPSGLDQPAVLVWTSGSTGEPKGVTLTLANLAYVVDQSRSIQGTGAEARWLSVLPPNHLLELCCGLLPAMAAASSTFVARTVVPHELATMMGDCGVNQMVVVPLVLRLLKRHVETTGQSLAGLVSCYCGGAPLDPGIVEFFDRLGIGVYQGYGLTEAAPAVSMNSRGHNRAGSVGRPLPGTEVSIADDGEIKVRGPGVMVGYWQDPDGTREAIDDQGWLHTGDLGYVDDEGYLFVTGRAKSLIVLDSGKKVQPEEVETALGRSEAFAEVCVVGIRGPGDHGEAVCAVIVVADPMSQDEAEDTVRRLTAGLSPYKRPTAVRLHDGELPRTPKATFRRAEIARMLQGAETRR